MVLMRSVVASVIVVLSAVLVQSGVALAASPGQHADGQSAGRQARTRPAPAPAPPPSTAPVTPPPVTAPPVSAAPFQSTLKFEPTQRTVDRVAAPLPVDRLGRPFVLATPWLVDGAMAPGFVASGPLSYALPSSAAPGGVQLDVQPWRAQVYVDGTYVGVVRDFTGYYHHLEVGAGPHVIAIVTPDYEPLVLELFVSPGRVTTYHGTLSPSGR